MSARSRDLAASLLVVMASAAIVLALVVGYVRTAAVDSDQFANRATVALRDPSVRALIAERVTDQIVLKKKADLIAARPLIQSVLSSVVGGRAFTSAFRSGVRDLHRALFNRDQHTLTLAVGDIGTIAAAALDVVRPSLADRVRTTGKVELVRRDIGNAAAIAARAADVVRVLAWLLLLVAVACAAGAVALAQDRRRAVVRLGIGAAIGGVVILVALGVLRSVAVNGVDGADARDAVGAVWDAFLGDLGTEAWILAAAGAVVAAAAASLIRPVEIEAPLRRAAHRVTVQPTRPALRILRALAFVTVGLVVLLDGETVLALLLAASGLYLVYVGVSAILRMVYQPREVTARPGRGGVSRPQRRRAILAALVAGAIVVGSVAAFVGGGGATTDPPAPVACNGSRALCQRTLDQIALPATHNAMSVPLPGWFSAEQEDPIAAQLGAGIRGLLVDTHYADRLPNGRLRTYVGDPKQLLRKAGADGVSPSAVDAALRTRERLGFSGKGKRGIYLCHSFCELGGTALGSVLTDLHDFLVANPGEVVVVINQDYITPKDFVGAVQKAGLADLAYSGPTEPGRWLTLREMIDRNQRVVFLAENRAGAAPWYRPAYTSITVETPYAFGRPRQLTEQSQLGPSCRPNRGPAKGSLFLVNHWVTTTPIPLPSDASKVNAYGALMRRLNECRRIRGHLPNLVAVNFYRRGDLFRAVNALNRTPVR
jgi:hypothetical protein